MLCQFCGICDDGCAEGGEFVEVSSVVCSEEDGAGVFWREVVADAETEQHGGKAFVFLRYGSHEPHGIVLAENEAENKQGSLFLEPLSCGFSVVHPAKFVPLGLQARRRESVL